MWGCSGMEGRRGAEELGSRWAPSIATFLMRKFSFLPPQGEPRCLRLLSVLQIKMLNTEMVDYVQTSMPHSFSAKYCWEKRVMRGVWGLEGCWEQEHNKIQPKLEKSKTELLSALIFPQISYLPTWIPNWDGWTAALVFCVGT